MTKKTWITAVVFGLPWSVVMIIYNSLRYKEVSIVLIFLTLILGLGMGLIFAWVMKYTLPRLLKKVVVEIGQDERLIKEAGASHFKGIEGVGGKLVLTNRRLIFKSHKLNVQNHQQDFELTQIEKLEATSTLKLFENGLTIQLANKEIHKFIVDDPEEWVDVITIQKLSPQIA